MRIDVDLTRVKTPLATLETARNTAAALCEKTSREAGANLVVLREIERGTRECASKWPGPVAVAREVESHLRAEQKGAEKRKARLERAIRWAQRRLCLRRLWRRLGIRRTKGDGRH